MSARPSLRDLSDPMVLLSTWGGSGLLRPAPGTWGSLAALPPGLLILLTGGGWALTFGALVVLIIGVFSSEATMKRFASHDPGYIVIDEVAGLWIALIASNGEWPLVLLAFMLFRLFDIVKPWPVGWADRQLEGAIGVMADDVLAGLYALAGTWIGAAVWEALNV